MFRDEFLMRGHCIHAFCDHVSDTTDKIVELLWREQIYHRVIACRLHMLTKKYLHPADDAKQFIVLAEEPTVRFENTQLLFELGSLHQKVLYSP